ncbi:MAG TPA: HI0074 family nucleotidyltransferase substrate-binding subunit [Spirochaetota bacterium]|nr:HI0074 family nucleotidyltransferase substrate-binding subunit [Spirochaetota bacterium]HPJ36153.1 HI0074 family nucleotidyltransferase substrate-binding subunit [Spirochaetota bacterium]
MLEYDKLKKSLIHLEMQYENFLTMNQRDNLTQLDREGISESVVQRFETCYDMLWKHLKKYLEDETGLPDVPNSPKPVLRIAFENHIIEDMEKWIDYANARVGTAHDYSEQKFKQALDKTGDFIKDAISVYCKMTKEQWPA